MNPSTSFAIDPLRSLRLAAMVATAVIAVSAAAADIAQSPLNTSSNTAVKTNVMLIVDDSSTMAYDYLPDNSNTSNWCFGYSPFNHLFYNPASTYSPPLKADGVTRYPNSLFNNAWDDGFAGGNSKTNLSVANNLTTPSINPPGCTRNCTKTRFYYATYTGTSAFSSAECTKSNFSLVTSLTTAEQQNYANWYSYYRTRILAMRTAVGDAFAGLDQTYRVGFSTINETGVADNTRFLNIRDYVYDGSGTSQRELFYSKLYATQGNVAGTPLRGALSKAGQYFAGKAPQQTLDPVQYACQRNYAIMATDGQWNTNTESTSPNYGPYKLDNATLVGQQDYVTNAPANPMRPALDDCHTKSECGGQTPTSTATPGYGADNTLADVAYYYFNTPLRSAALGNCTVTVGGSSNNVCTGGKVSEKKPVYFAGTDPSPTWQHMSTYTIGLGTAGLLKYVDEYLTNQSSATNDYFNILNNNAHWPAPYAANGANPGAANIDDLWHAAVNGNGRYFSTSDADNLASSLKNALKDIESQTGAGSAAATSNLQPISGDNYVFAAKYWTVEWAGELLKYTIDPSTGVITPVSGWSAQAALDAMTWSTRNIYYSVPAASGPRTRRSFTYTNLTTDGLASNFTGMCSAGGNKLSQCATLTPQQQTDASGANLVAFLSGDRSNEATAGNNTSPLYRARTHVLGDVINATPVYVSKPPFLYTENGYATFQANNASRTPVVYLAANDGMLHAIDATSTNSTGNELWAYIPSMVMANLHHLADENYASNHRFFVDGSPSVGDVWDGTNWRTILVGGLGGGGRGYYALDITNPASPIVLWEYTDGDLGLTYGNPVITKRKDGTWVVAFASGYNDNSFTTTTGNGFLYVLNAVTGTQLLKIPTYTSGTTPAGTTAAPSGLAKINAWVASDRDNTALRFYGGDMLGNVWRFDTDNNVQPNGAALLLANLKVGTTPQPITVKPELAEITRSGTRIAVVFVGTGRYLGTTDLTDMSQQSVYAFKDNLTATGLGDLRNDPNMVQQTLTDATSTRTISSATVDWLTQDGWYVDFNPANTSPGERVNVQMQQQGSMLSVATNIPGTDACAPAGKSWLYHFDINTGSSLVADHTVGTWLGNDIVVGIVTAELSNGKTVTIVTYGQGGLEPKDDGGKSPGNPTPRRTSWRELVN